MEKQVQELQELVAELQKEVADIKEDMRDIENAMLRFLSSWECMSNNIPKGC